MSAHSAAEYDLIGTPAERTQLMRATIAAILTSVQKSTFDQFKADLKGFLLRAARITNEQKATVLVEHLAYGPTFTQENPKDSGRFWCGPSRRRGRR